MAKKPSINRLNQLIIAAGFKIVRYYKARKYCAYVETISDIGDNVLITIPSNFKIKIDNSIGYEIRPLDIDDIESINNADSNGYDEILLDDIKVFDEDSNITKGLKQSYKEEISLEKVDKDKQLLEQLYNLVQRLQYCFSKLKYKIAVTCKKYICIFERDKSIDIYYIKKYQGNNEKNIFIVLGLDTLFEKIEKDQKLSLYNDLYNIQSKMYDILDKIQAKYLNSLNKITSNPDIINNITNILLKKSKNKKYLEQFYMLGIKNIENMREIKNDIVKLSETSGNIHSDTKLSMERSYKEDKLKEKLEIQDKLKVNSKMVRDSTNNMYVISDMIIYNNMVLADDISKSIKLLKME